MRLNQLLLRDTSWRRVSLVVVLPMTIAALVLLRWIFFYLPNNMKV